MTLLVGADPEFFVRNEKEKFISGHIFNCGTKDRPFKTEHGSVQVDGLALEVNVTPSADKSSFLKNLIGVLHDLSGIVLEKKCSVFAVPTVSFGQKYIKSLPRHVQELGCNPDFNAYTMDTNPRPNASADIRTGSGHIHLGWTEGKDTGDFSHFEECCALVKQLDYFVGLPSLRWDEDDQRRTLYGKAGAFRPKSYGLEYRVLSNRWCSERELAGEVFDRTTRAFSEFEKGNRPFERYLGLAAKIINTSNRRWAEEYSDLAKEVQ